MPPPYGSSDGAPAVSRFYSPTGIAAGNSGSVYVADSLNHTIRVVAPNGTVTTLAGVARQGGGADGVGANARFALPSGVAVVDDMLYVADRLNHAIRQVSPGGVVTTYAGVSGTSGAVDGGRMTARFNDPTDLVADASGNFYVVDRLNHVIRKITTSGLVSTLAGQAGTPGTADGVAGAARFAAPDGITLGVDGALYVADTNNHAIRRISLDGNVTTFAGLQGQAGAVDGVGTAARFRLPNRLTAHPDGRLVVSDTGNDCLRIITPQGQVSVFAGAPELPGAVNGPRATARFFGPTGIAFLPEGLVVADSLNHTLRRVGLNDQVTILAGPGGNFGRADGPPQVARFNRPNGIALHSSGDVYVADTQGNAIRRIAPDGSVTTVAGRDSDAYIDGPAGVASLNAPIGIAVAPDRTVYFCEQRSHTVRVLHPDGSVSTLAGSQGVAGSADGAGAVARFDFPSAIARDAAGNLYVADTGNHTIRRITAGVVSTVAGEAGTAGTSDGAGTAARFFAPHGLVVDGGGNIYVSDTGNHTIRRISSAGSVTTVAGFPGTFGESDGSGSSARFWNPAGLAFDRDGRLYVADTYNHTVRRIASGVVSTIGGRAGVPHYNEGTGRMAFFYLPNGVVVDPAGTVFVVQHGNNLVMKGAVDGMPTIIAQPQAVTVPAGGSATLSVAASGGGLSYQWKFNGAPIAGATNATLTVTDAQPAVAGSYSVDITNSAGSTSSVPVEVSVSPAAAKQSRIINLSILCALNGATEPFTMGYVVGGAGTDGAKPLVIRAAGPSLLTFGIEDRVMDPRLELFAGTTKAGENDDWGGSAELAGAMAGVGAFPYAAATSLDAATKATVMISGGAPSNNSVRVSTNGRGGRVLAEIYDATPEASVGASTPRLVNVSVLKEFGGGLTAGFVIRGGTTKRVLVRAIGPALAGFGITSGFVADPQVTLFRGTTELRSNNDWEQSAAATFERVGAFALTPGSKDSALVETLEPGDYTVQVSGVGGASGIGLIEVYEVP